MYCLPFAGAHTLSYRDFQANVAETILIKPLGLQADVRENKGTLTDKFRSHDR
ncbi:MAG: hypothetical protein KAI83_05160 [Thiomargarita sp.]|nr:hypothetical protein [Thiomargarita sp.]